MLGYHLSAYARGQEGYPRLNYIVMSDSVCTIMPRYIRYFQANMQKVFTNVKRHFFKIVIVTGLLYLVLSLSDRQGVTMMYKLLDRTACV